jgi:hypothetical protein
MKDYLHTITVVGNVGAVSLTDNSEHQCPLAVYVNWKGVACEVIDFSIPLQKQLINIIGIAGASNLYDHRDFRRPDELLLPASNLSRTLNRYAVDAAAAAIEEGPRCFEDDAVWKEIPGQISKYWWSSDTNPRNAVSRFSRQLRTHMNKLANTGLYVSHGRQVLAIGVVFEYLHDVRPTKGGKEYKFCMLGRSLVGDTVAETFGNHQIGASDTSELPPGDWSEVYNEVFLIILLGLAILVAPRWKQSNRRNMCC